MTQALPRLIQIVDGVWLDPTQVVQITYYKRREPPVEPDGKQWTTYVTFTGKHSWMQWSSETSEQAVALANKIAAKINEHYWHAEGFILRPVPRDDVCPACGLAEYDKDKPCPHLWHAIYLSGHDDY